MDALASRGRGGRFSRWAANAERSSFDRAILATGSVPTRLSVPGADLPGVLTSEGLIELKERPEHLVLIGGGPIGIEMAQIFRLLGSRATVLEVLPRILDGTDPVLAERLAAILHRDGVQLYTGVQVEAIEQVNGRYRVRYRAGARVDQTDGDVVGMVTGRHPNVDGLGLESTRVRYDHQGVKVDERLETDEPGIFAIGDVTGHPMFAHGQPPRPSPWRVTSRGALRDSRGRRPIAPSSSRGPSSA